MEHASRSAVGAGKGGRLRIADFLGSKNLALALFAVYAVALVWIILFKMQFSTGIFGTLRSVNLVPLAGALVVNGTADYGEVAQNVLAFAPFGLYMGMLMTHRPFWVRLAPVALTSLALEVAQFIFAAGASDITDLIANTLGGVVGLTLYALVRGVSRSDVRARRACNALALAGTVLVVGFLVLVLAANA